MASKAKKFEQQPGATEEAPQQTLDATQVTTTGEIEPQDKDRLGEELKGENQELEDNQELVDLMSSVPLDCIKGGSTERENRCTKSEIEKVVTQSAIMYGISKPTAAFALGELIRRGGANASTPDTFNVEIQCPQENTTACVEKREVVRILEKYVNGKSFRNLAEGMAEPIVKFGVRVVKSSSTAERAGDLAKKVNNRVTFRKEPPLTRLEKVGLASYAQWLPNLDELCESNRVKSLLAEDLDLRKAGQVKSQQDTRKGGSGKTQKKKKKK